MELVVVNGANAISRGVLSRLAGKNYHKIRLLDFRPFRKSVYEFQRQLPAGVHLEKVQVQNAAGLEHQLEGAKDVLYFTHDYCANTADKNSFVSGTAKIAKKHGVEKLVAVCPIEHELFYTEDQQSPLDKQREAQQLALQSNPKLTILNSNLIFGRDSYLIHYMTQSAAAGRILAQIGGSANFHYKPVSSDDLTAAVVTAFEKFDQAKGKKFMLNGKDETTLKNLLELIEQSLGKPQGQTKLVNSLLRLNISDYVEEFFVGITHDKNMRNMAEYLDAHRPNLDEGNADFLQEFSLTLNKSLSDEYGLNNRIKEEDLVFPIFSNYKMTSLD